MQRGSGAHNDLVRQGRLNIDLRARQGQLLSSGLHSIPIPTSRGALLYVPSNTNGKLPLIVSLHGAGGVARNGVEMLRSQADTYGFAIVAVSSMLSTWDVLVDSYGPDVRMLSEGLMYAVDHVDICPEQTAISGFSDGASYALSIGLGNADLFSSIVAFSPGFAARGEKRGKPRVFISHGARDAVLPIDPCSRAIVSRLRREQYDITYREFDGEHTVPEDIKRSAIEWWLARTCPGSDPP